MTLSELYALTVDKCPRKVLGFTLSFRVSQASFYMLWSAYHGEAVPVANGKTNANRAAENHTLACPPGVAHPGARPGPGGFPPYHAGARGMAHSMLLHAHTGGSPFLPVCELPGALDLAASN